MDDIIIHFFHHLIIIIINIFIYQSIYIFYIPYIRIIIIRLIKKRIGSTVEYYLFGYKIMVFIVIVGNTMEYA